MCEEIARLGFSLVELSHGIPLCLVPGIIEAVKANIIKISSVHNFCPLPPGHVLPAPNLYQPSSPYSKEIALWRLYTQKSIEFAHSLNAPFLVTHLGSVKFFFNRISNKLNQVLTSVPVSELKSKPEFQKITAKYSKKYAKFEKKVTEEILTILPFAASHKVKIAVENRNAVHELPSDQSLSSLIQAFQPHAGYWHDSGHAQMKEFLGLSSQADLLEANADHLLGFHLKDLDQNGSESIALGKGSIDFNFIKKFIKPHHTVVLEVPPSMTQEDLLYSKKFLEDLI